MWKNEKHALSDLKKLMCTSKDNINDPINELLKVDTKSKIDDKAKRDKLKSVSVKRSLEESEKYWINFNISDLKERYKDIDEIYPSNEKLGLFVFEKKSTITSPKGSKEVIETSNKSTTIPKGKRTNVLLEAILKETAMATELRNEEKEERDKPTSLTLKTQRSVLHEKPNSKENNFCEFLYSAYESNQRGLLFNETEFPAL